LTDIAVIDRPATASRRADRERGCVLALRRWGISGVSEVRRVAEGLMNRNYRVDSDRGRFFLKQFLDIAGDQIAFQHRVTTALARAGLPVPAPIALPDGGTRVTVRGERYALYPWVAGRHRHGLELSLDECGALGRLLARLHAELAGIMPPVQQTLVVPTSEPQDTVAMIERLLGRLRRQASRDAFDELAERRLSERGPLLDRFADQRPAACDTPVVGYVHGDFHALNLLYDGGEVIAILDWDRLSVRPYTLELVRAATLFFGHGDERGLDLDRVRAFAGAYRRESGIDVPEIRRAVHRMWWERLNDLWMLEWRYLRDDCSCDHLFPGAAALVEWWTQRRDQVLAAFCSS
jgi:Ser/Thr protein kinase RdoA (MazF antagonist)